MTDLETYPGFKDAFMDKQTIYSPIGINILTKQVDAKKENDYGLLMSMGNDVQNRPDVAKVIAIGDDVTDVAIGETIFFSKYAGIRMNVDNTDYLLLSRSEVFGFNNKQLKIIMGETKDLLGIMENVGKMIEGD